MLQLRWATFQLRWATCKHCWIATAAAGGEEWRNLERGENTKGMPLIQPPQADKEAQKQTNKVLGDTLDHETKLKGVFKFCRVAMSG